MLLECVLLTVKLVVLVAVPPGVVTLIVPVVAVVGTVAVIWVAEFTTNVAVTLLKVTRRVKLAADRSAEVRPRDLRPTSRPVRRWA